MIYNDVYIQTARSSNSLSSTFIHKFQYLALQARPRQSSSTNNALRIPGNIQLHSQTQCAVPTALKIKSISLSKMPQYAAPPHAPRILLANCMSFCMIVTRFACIAQRLVSSNRWTRKASEASCKACRAVLCHLKCVLSRFRL